MSSQIFSLAFVVLEVGDGALGTREVTVEAILTTDLPGNTFFQVYADVIGDTFTVDNVSPSGSYTITNTPGVAGLPAAGGELVQRPEKGRQRLAAAGGGRGQQMLTGGDTRPAFRLHAGGLGEAGLEPPPDGGLEAGQCCRCRLLPCQCRPAGCSIGAAAPSSWRPP